MKLSETPGGLFSNVFQRFSAILKSFGYIPAFILSLKENTLISAARQWAHAWLGAFDACTRESRKGSRGYERHTSLIAREKAWAKKVPIVSLFRFNLYLYPSYELQLLSAGQTGQTVHGPLGPSLLVFRREDELIFVSSVSMSLLVFSELLVLMS